MAWTTAERPSQGEYDDREKVKFAIGLDLKGTVVRISGRKPSTFGGEVRYIDVDAEDGRQLTFGVGGWKLDDYFEPQEYREGDGIWVTVESAPTKDGKKNFGLPTFRKESRGGRAAAKPEPEAAEFPAPVGGGNGAFDDEPPF